MKIVSGRKSSFGGAAILLTGLLAAPALMPHHRRGLDRIWLCHPVSDLRDTLSRG